MNTKKILVIATALLSAPLTALAQSYTATALDFTADAISNSGQIVGNDNSNRGSEGILYSNGTITDLGAFSPFAINNNGMIAGTIDINGSVTAATYANGTVTNLGTLGPEMGLATSQAIAINDRGEVIGNSSSPNGNRSFLYSPDTRTMIALPCTNARCFTASDISNSGQIAGLVSIPNAKPPGGLHDNAAVYSQGAITDLGTLTSGTVFPQNESSAAAINNSGEIAGTSFDASNNVQAVVYKDGTITALGIVNSVNDINDRGEIVGEDADGAFLWNGKSLIDLNSTLSQALPGGLSLTAAFAINDSGEILADAFNSSGQEETFLLTPHAAPEVDPASAVGSLTLLLGALAVLRGRGRRGETIPKATV